MGAGAEAVEAEPEREPLPLLRVNPAAGEHVGVDHAAATELEPRAVGAADVELGRRLREREVGRSQPRREVAAEERLGECVEGSGQVGEGDVPIDHQALDLVEHRHVGGVGGVLAVHATRHDHVDRWWLRGHHPHLHGGGVGPQHRRAGLPHLHVQRVVHVARGVVGREVECPEVVPVGLDLRPLRDREAHADEHVLELLHGLRDQVEVTGAPPGRHLREVEPLARDLKSAGLGLELGPAGGQGRLQRMAGPVDRGTGGLALLGLEAAEPALQERQR